MLKSGVSLANAQTIERRDYALGWQWFELLAIFVLVASVVGLVSLRFGVFHAAHVWIFSVLATFFYGRFFLLEERERQSGVPVWHLVLLLGVALFFRVTPYDYILGGQDEGVYTNMGAELLRTGGLAPVDPVLSNIDGTEFRRHYVEENYRPKEFLPGVYNTKDGLEFQFYHLFPVWLALFGAVFGMHGAVYGLSFLSLVSVLFFYRLAVLISGRPIVGLLAGALLAVNPLHVFFSKFPVTEVPTLAFSLISFSFLLSSLRSKTGLSCRTHLVISLVALGMLFMTRISGFMYVPLICTVFVFAFTQAPGSRENTALFVWGGCGLALYVASVAYGFEWSGVYAKDIYDSSFKGLLGGHWQKKLSVGIVLVGAGLGVYCLRCHNNAAERKRLLAVFKVVSGGLSLLVLIFCGVALFKAYRLGYTDSYATQFAPGGRYWFSSLMHKGISSVRSISLVAAASYLSPFMLAAFFVAVFAHSAGAVMRFLLFFVVSFLGYVAFLQWHLPYQPYYARYLVSEFVPYLILFVVCTWGGLGAGRVRVVLASLMGLAFAYSAYFSIQQVGKVEHHGVALSLDRLTSHFDQRDLVLIDGGLVKPLAHEVKTALLYSYGLAAATIGEHSLADVRYLNALSRKFQDVYYVSIGSSPPDGFVLVDSVQFTERMYCHGNALPTRLCTRTNSRLMLYRRLVSTTHFPGDIALDYDSDDDALGTMVGRKEYGQLVATGKPGFVMYGPYGTLSQGDYQLVIRGHARTPFVLDVAGNIGKDVFAQRRFAGAEYPEDGILARLEFRLDNPVKDLEVRLRVEQGSDTVIDGYEIIYR